MEILYVLLGVIVMLAICGILLRFFPSKDKSSDEKTNEYNDEFNNQGELKSEVDQESVPQYKFGCFGRIVSSFLAIFVCMFVVALIPQILGMRSGYPFALLACLYILTFVKPVWQTPKENATKHLLKYGFSFLMCTIMSFIYIAIAIPISTEIYDRQVIGIAPGVLIIIPWILTVKLSHYLFSEMDINESTDMIPDTHLQNAPIEKNKDSASLNREEEKQLTYTSVNDIHKTTNNLDIRFRNLYSIILCVVTFVLLLFIVDNSRELKDLPFLYVFFTILIIFSIFVYRIPLKNTKNYILKKLILYILFFFLLVIFSVFSFSNTSDFHLRVFFLIFCLSMIFGLNYLINKFYFSFTVKQESLPKQTEDVTLSMIKII